MEDALRLDVVNRNPTHGATLPRIPTAEPQWCSDEQLPRLFELTEGHRFHALWVLLGRPGLRLGETLELK